MSLYLSKLMLDAKRRFIWEVLGDCHKLHCQIMRAFPQLDNVSGQESKAREQFGVLYRVEFERRTGAASVLVQSKLQPDWGQCINLLGAKALASVKEIGELYDNLTDEAELMFRLSANPSKRVGKSDERADPKFKDDKNRRRVEIRNPDEQIAWLRRKGEAGGFRLTHVHVKETIDNVSATPMARVTGRSKNLVFGGALFEGVLQITDVVQFKQTLTNGIGQGKAYGLGLLSIARPLSF